MKILTANQQRELDRKTIQAEPISSLDLMERAAECWTNQLSGYLEIYKRINKTPHFGIFCGPGNNGGDGLVIARRLDEMGYKITCFFVGNSDSVSKDFEHNRKRLEDTQVNWTQINESFDSDLMTYGLTDVIDAIFGTGLSRPAEGIAKQIIDKINTLNVPIFSVDVPSGLYCDKLNGKGDSIVNASFTFTFHSPKLSFFIPSQSKYVGHFNILDIGLKTERLKDLDCSNYYVTINKLSRIKKVRSRFSHKGTYGHAGVIAGSATKMGAALLASEASLRSGAGLTTAYVPDSGSIAFNTRIPSVMLSYTGHTTCENIDVTHGVSYGIGPGIGTSEGTISAFKSFLNRQNDPIVIDADALNILAKRKELLSIIPKKSIFTPHPKEFERLCGSFKNGYERLNILRSFAVENDFYIVLKDAYTSIATPEGDLYFSTFGSSGMATGGSGDVLTGIITGLLAQGYEPEESAILGVGLHGIAGEECAKELGEQSMISEDILTFLPKAFKKV